jgi:hypothetical protein
VIDDVLELVSDGAALTSPTLVAVDGDDPLGAGPVTDAGYGQGGLDDSDAREVVDKLDRDGAVFDTERSQQSDGLQLGDAQRLDEGELARRSNSPECADHTWRGDITDN